MASILFERRSATVRTHKQEVCFPGGMVEEVRAIIKYYFENKIDEKCIYDSKRVDLLYSKCLDTAFIDEWTLF